MINAMILILRLLTFRTWMGTLLVKQPTVFIYHNYFGSPDCLDFNTRNKSLTAKLLNQGYRHPKLRKAFINFIDVISI